MGYLGNRNLTARGGYGVARARGGLPLLALAGSLVGKLAPKAISAIGKAVGRVGAKVGPQLPAIGTGVTIGRLTAPQRGPAAFGTDPVRRRRRMNVANPKALRRAIRRTDGFVKLAKRTLKGTGLTIKRTGAPGARKKARR
jgi:hypothetical protein